MTAKSKLTFYLRSLCLVFLIAACQNLDDINSRLDNVENEIVDIKTSIKLLEDAYNSGKVITNMTQLSDESGVSTGWSITFSDDSSINILNGEKGNDGILDVIKNEDDNSLTIILTDGRQFEFQMAGPSATSIILLSDSKICLDQNGEEKIIFRINPSDAMLDLNVNNPTCQIALDIAGECTRSSMVVKEPVEFKLSGVKQSLFEDGSIIPGQYEATIKDVGEYIAYSHTVVLVIAGTGKSQISSHPFTICSSLYPEVGVTGLPIVIIETPDEQPVTSKNDWMKNVQMKIYDKDKKLDYEGSLSVKGRGNSTWGFPKKPYALKLDSKSKILGMKKHKRWCLLANWMDRTMIRNAVAFEISRSTDLRYTPSGQFVELILNGKHVGNYYLTEQIKVDENRVDIAELDANATSGDGITGGYIFELDTNFDEVYKFKSETKDFPWMFKDPDDVNDAQFEYAMNYVNSMERALYDEEAFKKRIFEEYMDLESFVDWWFVYELAMNCEPAHPKSSYMHKDINGRMNAGPVWDFDWGTFTPGSTGRFCIKNRLYYDKLFEDEKFVALVKERWNILKPKFDAIPLYIEELKESLRKSDEINSAMWPISSTTNGDESLEFDNAIDKLKNSYTSKLSWMDVQIKGM